MRNQQRETYVARLDHDGDYSGFGAEGNLPKVTIVDESAEPVKRPEPYPVRKAPLHFAVQRQFPAADMRPRDAEFYDTQTDRTRTSRTIINAAMADWGPSPESYMAQVTFDA